MKNKKFNLGSNIYGKNTIKKIRTKINLLGVNCTLDPINLLNIRLFTSISIFFVLLYFLDFGYLIAPIVTFLVYILFFQVVVDTKIKKRQRIIEKDSLYFFEILALSLEAGRNIKTAIEVTCSNIDSELSDEFKKVLTDVKFGKDLNEALNDLKFRIPSDTVNNIILNIREANIFGNNVIETVFSQIDYIREKRVLEAKAYINKIPVKISIVSVVFFIPLLLLLLLSPMIIELLS